jgi:streptogramin lyase
MFALAALIAALALPTVQGGTSTSICARTPIPYPQHALAQSVGSLWLTCRERGALVRLTPAGKQVASIRLPGIRPWAVAGGAGAVWVVDRDQPLLLRIDPKRNRVAARISLPSGASDVWAGAGSLWVALDAQGAVARIDPRRNRVAAIVPTGDGPSGFATDGQTVWVANHRDGTIVRIPFGARRALPVAHVGAGDVAPERLAFASGSLWATGRGLDLVRVDPVSGGQDTVEVGAAGIDVVAAAGRVWVAVATPTGARRGDPTVERLAAVDPETNAVVESRPAVGALSLDGLAADGRQLWLADTVHGALVRVPQ